MKIILAIFLIIIFIPVFGQRPPYDDEPITVEDFDQIVQRLEKLENFQESSKNDFPVELLIAAIVVAAAIIGIVISDIRTRKALKLTENAHIDARKSSEANFLLAIENKFADEKIKRLMNAITKKLPILKPAGEFHEGDLWDYLSNFEILHRFLTNELLTDKTVVEMYGGSIKVAWENSEIQNYITKSRAKYEKDVWGGFEELAKIINKK